VIFVWKIQSITNSNTPAKHIKAAGGKWNKQKKLREAPFFLYKNKQSFFLPGQKYFLYGDKGNFR